MSGRTLGELQLPSPALVQSLAAAAARVAEAASRVAAKHPGNGFAVLRQQRQDQVTRRMIALRTGRLYCS